jgi:serine phosphatase RsbU (regulator of sigma subunit)
MRGFISSLRFRLLVLVLLGGLPALGVILYTAAEQRRKAAEDIQQNALRVARLASAGQERMIEGARQVLMIMSHLPEVRGDDPQAATRLLANLLQQYPVYMNFGVIELDGQVFASGLAMPKDLNLADRTYFKRAIETRDFAMGEYQIGRITGKPAVNFGYPILDETGVVRRVVYAALNLAWLEKHAAQAELPEGGTLTVVDGRGTILVRWPEPERWRGESLRGQPIWQTIASEHQGTAQVRGIEGVPSLFAFTELRGAEGAGFVSLNIGVPTKVAFAEPDRILRRNLLLLGAAGVLVVAAAWFGSDWFVLRRVNALLDATKRLEAGDLGARTGMRYGSGEIGRLAHSFDSMAASLQQRGAERDRAEAELKALNVELEQRVADRTAELREKNEQLEADLVLAREFQLALLPTAQKEFLSDAGANLPKIQFCHSYQAWGAVGGDFFDIRPISGTKVAVAVCDVMGHGVRAALVTAILRGLFEEHRPLAADPGQFFTAVNRGLVQLIGGTGTTVFVTACYLVVDLREQNISYANAGHPWPLHLRRHDGLVESLRNNGSRPGPALGLIGQFEYQTEDRPLTADDALLLFTDGVFEVTGPNHEQFGNSRLLDAVGTRLQLPTYQVLQEVLVEARSFSPSQSFDDDVCVVGVDLAGPERIPTSC